MLMLNCAKPVAPALHEALEQLPEGSRLAAATATANAARLQVLLMPAAGEIAVRLSEQWHRARARDAGLIGGLDTLSDLRYTRAYRSRGSPR
jgi:hypothetical protein